MGAAGADGAAPGAANTYQRANHTTALRANTHPREQRQEPSEVQALRVPRIDATQHHHHAQQHTRRDTYTRRRWDSARAWCCKTEEQMSTQPTRQQASAPDGTPAARGAAGTPPAPGAARTTTLMTRSHKPRPRHAHTRGDPAAAGCTRHRRQCNRSFRHWGSGSRSRRSRRSRSGLHSARGRLSFRRSHDYAGHEAHTAQDPVKKCTHTSGIPF